MTETGAIVRRVLVGGAVQGVGYREFTRRAALRLGVTGWVRNRSDGGVEVLICGPAIAVEADRGDAQGTTLSRGQRGERDRDRRHPGPRERRLRYSANRIATDNADACA